LKIDAHQHYWKIARNDYGWITPDVPKLYRNFLPGDLEPLLAKHGLDGTIVVQAAPTTEETEFILSLADRHASILGVVGWLDLYQPDHRRHYERFRRNPKFVGIRIMIQDMPDSSRILEPPFVEALRGYADVGTPVDLLMRSNQLEDVLELLRRVPHLRGVIDHSGKPRVRDRVMEPWAGLMAEITRFPGIRCKLSGLVTEADPAGWKPEDFQPYVSHVLDIFGPNRVMFGSDWPVCLLAADYDDCLELVRKSLPAEWGNAELARLFGGNAKEFYKL